MGIPGPGIVLVRHAHRADESTGSSAVTGAVIPQWSTDDQDGFARSSTGVAVLREIGPIEAVRSTTVSTCTWREELRHAGVSSCSLR